MKIARHRAWRLAIMMPSQSMSTLFF